MISDLFYFNSCAVSNSDPPLPPTPKLKYLPMHQFCKDQSINYFQTFLQYNHPCYMSTKPTNHWNVYIHSTLVSHPWRDEHHAWSRNMTICVLLYLIAAHANDNF